MKQVVTIAWILAGLVFPASSAHAETIPNGLQKSICQPGTVAKSSGSFLTISGGLEEMEKLVGSTNFCTNERVTLEMGFGAHLNDKVTCICTNQQQFQTVGCGREQTQPTVTTVIPIDKSGCVSDSITISKCEADPKAAYKAKCQSEKSIVQVPPSVPSATAPVMIPAVQPRRVSELLHSLPPLYLQSAEPTALQAMPVPLPTATVMASVETLPATARGELPVPYNWGTLGVLSYIERLPTAAPSAPAVAVDGWTFPSLSSPAPVSSWSVSGSGAPSSVAALLSPQQSFFESFWDQLQRAARLTFTI